MNHKAARVSRARKRVRRRRTANSGSPATDAAKSRSAVLSVIGAPRRQGWTLATYATAATINDGEHSLADVTMERRSFGQRWSRDPAGCESPGDAGEGRQSRQR